MRWAFDTEVRLKMLPRHESKGALEARESIKEALVAVFGEQ
jgi:hypothetical protein